LKIDYCLLCCDTTEQLNPIVLILGPYSGSLFIAARHQIQSYQDWFDYFFSHQRVDWEKLVWPHGGAPCLCLVLGKHLLVDISTLL